jgi:multidrug resistance efflux pump
MRLLKRHRVTLVLLGLLVLVGFLVVHRFHDQQARAIIRSQASMLAAQAQLRVAEVQVVTQQSRVRLAEAQVESYRAALRLAETDPSKTRLVGPFSGYIAQRTLDPGAAVSASSGGTSTTSEGILAVQNIETVRAQIEVPERDIARVTVGARVSIATDPDQGVTFNGKVVRVVHNLDPRSRTMGVAAPPASRGSSAARPCSIGGPSAASGSPRCWP